MSSYLEIVKLAFISQPWIALIHSIPFIFFVAILFLGFGLMAKNIYEIYQPEENQGFHRSLGIAIVFLMSGGMILFSILMLFLVKPEMNYVVYKKEYSNQIYNYIMTQKIESEKDLANVNANLNNQNNNFYDNFLKKIKESIEVGKKIDNKVILEEVQSNYFTCLKNELEKIKQDKKYLQMQQIKKELKNNDSFCLMYGAEEVITNKNYLKMLQSNE